MKSLQTKPILFYHILPANVTYYYKKILSFIYTEREDCRVIYTVARQAIAS